MRRFLVCVHDASPAYEQETRTILQDLAPLVGRRLSCAVVPDWHGRWPLAAHREYCRLLRESSEELVLHGYSHHRQRGHGPASWLAESSDEMNGLDAGETRRMLARGQDVFTDVFGAPARTFLAPAWQLGRARLGDLDGLRLDRVLGFFSLESRTSEKVPLATWTWDCGRWRRLGHVGHATGWLLQSLGRRVPVLAIHPRDLTRGFWPRILRVTRHLLSNGYEPSTSARLVEAE